MINHEAAREALKKVLGYDVQGRTPLTPRQLEYIKIIAKYKTVKEAADASGINYKTLIRTRATCFRKGYAVQEFQNEKSIEN